MEHKELNLKVICGNNIETLKTYPDNYFDSVVTDAPYGLGKEPIAEQVMRDWIEKGYHEISGSGFMGKEWDAFVPQPLFWKEVFRVLKHGGHVVSFFGTRTYDWGVMAMRFAGFEVRDCIQWLYGSGFPKSHNIGKALEAKILFNDASGRSQKLLDGKRVNAGMHLHKISYEQGVEKKDYSEISRDKVIDVCFKTEEGKQWEGWGSALKPANEPIVLARKPLEKGLSIAENVLKWGVGGINIDGCRVGEELIKGQKASTLGNGLNMSGGKAQEEYMPIDNKGRFPANLILSHHPDCVCNGLKKVKGIVGGKNDIVVESKFGQVSNTPQKPFDYTDENGNETIEDWTCHEDCPIRIMDEQSGISKSNDSKRNRQTLGSFGMPNDETPEYNDKGGASRFFYCAKASKSERNNGLEGFEEKQTKGGGGGIGDYLEDVNSASGKYGSEKAPSKNFHPTVKPVKLMQYLVRMVTPPNGIVLDPFCGSGTTGIACKLEGLNFVGIDITPEYCEIADARIKNFVEEEDEKLKMIDDEEDSKWTQLSLF